MTSAELAAELVRLKVDLIVVASNPAALAAKAPLRLPIVMANPADPVAQVWLPVWRVREVMSPDFRV